MPEYDISCKNCGQKYNWICSVNTYKNKIKEKCDKCGKTELFQDFTGRKTLPFILKGWGWTRKIGTMSTTNEVAEAERENDELHDLGEKNAIDDNIVKRYREQHGPEK